MTDYAIPPSSHAWVSGAGLLGAELATCARCFCLRVVERDRPVTFIRKTTGDDRVLEVEPLCVAPRSFGAPVIG